MSFDIKKPRNRFGCVDTTVGNYPSRDSCTQASAVTTTVCGIINATLCKRKWHWAWIYRLAPPTLSTSLIVQVPFLILLYIVTEKRRVAQRIIRLMWLFLKEARAAITHPPRAHLKSHEPSILSLSYLSPVVNVVLEKAGLSVEICVCFSRANHDNIIIVSIKQLTDVINRCFLSIVFFYGYLWCFIINSVIIWQMSCVIFENDPQMNAGSFIFVLGCGKKNSSLSCYWRNYGSTRSRGETLNDFEYFCPLMRKREPDN